jgi:hypothetical protein
MFAGRDHLGEEADRQCLLGLDDPPAEDHVEGAAHSDDPWEPLGAAVDQRHPPAALGEAELRRLGADPEVAPERQLQPSSERPAGDCGDRRLR